MNIFYFSSDAFASVMATSIVSVLENNKHAQSIVFYVVDDGISAEKKKKLQMMVERYVSLAYERKIIYLDAPDPEDILKYPFKSRYQMGHSYFRMCIGTLLPKDVHRVLCLDSDTLVLRDLEELWNIDLGDNIMAGVSDCMNVQKYRRQFRMDDSDIYCNAGMFLVDLDKWRIHKIQDKIIKRIFDQNGNVFFFEQTLMNWSCKGKILRLEPKYNVYTLFWAFTYENLMIWRRPLHFYSKEEVNKAKQNPAIIHYTRNFYMMSRPWIEDCDHSMTDEYRKYMKLTPWPELKPDQRSKSQVLKYKLWHSIPERTLCRLANNIYNNVRPKLWWKNE